MTCLHSMHAFDMPRDEDLIRRAIKAFERRFDHAIDHAASASRGGKTDSFFSDGCSKNRGK